jgi:hypothetical protein
MQKQFFCKNFHQNVELKLRLRTGLVLQELQTDAGDIFRFDEVAENLFGVGQTLSHRRVHPKEEQVGD